MDLDNLLAYQKADMRLRRINGTLAGGEKKQKVDSIRAAYSEESKRAVAAEASATQIMNAYAEAESQADELIKRAQELGREDGNDETIARLAAVKEELAKISATLASLKAQSEKALRAYKTAQENGKKYRAQYEQATKEYNEEKSKYGSEIATLEKEVVDLRAKVDAKLLERYDSLVGQRITNPFVEAAGSNKSYSCGGCFMALSQSLADTLEKTGFCQCDSCKRIIYKK